MSSEQLNSRPLEKMFSEVPKMYDFLNRLLTWRLDEIWRKHATSRCLENNPTRVLDLCTGTGDLALRIAKHAHPQTEVIGLDFSQPMLNIAKEKAKRQGLNKIHFIYGDAAQMPFPDEYFETIGIGFAFRNLTYRNPSRDLYLSELFRILRKGGRFVIVETSQPKAKFIKYTYHLYLNLIVAKLGGLLSGHSGAYRYLAHSARNYYNSEELSFILKNIGFQKVEDQSFLKGVAAVHVAIK